jgi:peroxiredoxin
MTDLAALEEAAEQRWLASWLEGPTRTRYEELPPQAGDLAPDPLLPDTSGEPRRLSDFWTHGPVLVIFMRHFGCSCLQERWEGLKIELADYANAGARVVAICQAEPERAWAVA